MDWSAVFQFFGALSGIAAVAAGVATLVGNHVSSRIIQTHKAELDRELESHKGSLAREADRNRLLLKRQELMFEREYAAASDFLRIFEAVIPDPWSPGPDWWDAQRVIAENLGNHEAELKAFLRQHSASLSSEARKHIEAAKGKANEGKFEVAQEISEGEYERGSHPSETTRVIIDAFVDDLNKAEQQIRADLREGSFEN